MSNHTLTLILGGARSGKSTRALALAEDARRVVFVATAEALDTEMADRIAVHRRERPANWETIEEPVSIARALRATRYDVTIIDCLTLWVSNLLLRELDIDTATTELLDSYRDSTGQWVVVSNEVGLGIVPDNPLARRYRDALGTVNRAFASAADRVELLVAGIPLRVK
jgi:adenosyl cobinamide kinase/adenosyl cobinamide phosphate guanylyltransferase